MKNLLNRSRFLAIFTISLLVFAFSAVSPVQAKPVSVGTPASLRALRDLGTQQCIQPPQHLNPKTLSDAQLALYGLPDHAILESAPAFWSTQLAHYHHRACGTGPSLRNHEQLKPSVTGISSSRWAGNATTGSRGQYREAMVTFTVPWVSGSVGDTSSFWAGVGGTTYDYGLIQAGVDEEVQPGWQYNYAWWEYHIGANYQDTAADGSTFTTLPVYPGDIMSVFVSSNYQGDGYNYFSVCNETRSTCGDSPVYVYSNFSDSASGECMGERIGSTGQQPPLADFGAEQLNTCDIEGNDWGSQTNGGVSQGVGMWPHNYDYIVGSCGVMVTIGAITGYGDSFPLYWNCSQ